MPNTDMPIQKVFSFIDPEAIARDTLDFVKVKSETGKEGPGSLFLANLMRREGLDVTLDEFEPNRPNIYAFIPAASAPSGSAGPTLLFNGHTDTIPIGNSAPAGRDGDWIVGRGTEDMKGGLVAMVHAASALRKAGVRLAGHLWLTGVIGHEIPIGKKEGPDRLIHHLRSGKIKTDAIIIVEGPAAIWAASLGLTAFTVTLESDKGPIHTIKVPYKENPACWLGRLLHEFELMEQRYESGTTHPLCGREQLNVGLLRGGDYFNRLPWQITVSGTKRWMPGKTMVDIRNELETLLHKLQKESGLHWTVSFDGHREPFETPSSHPVVAALQSAGQSLTGKSPEIIGMGLVGDANLYFNDARIPAVYYGPAHQTAHSDFERVAIQQLAHCAKVYALAAMNFCGLASF